MNYSRYFLVALCISINAVGFDPSQLVIVLMVKNEETVINATIEPFVKEGLDSFLIFDTGSTDTTVKTISDYFNRNGICHGIIEQEPFIDFATSRNRALALAQEHFPNALFMLMLDAEWYMHNVKGLLNFCAAHAHDVHNKVYLLKIASPNLSFYTPRLLRCRVGIQFVGAVHEIPNECAHIRLDPSIYFELSVGRFGYEKSKKRWERDVEILLREHAKNPDDSRTTFYLAQTYECLNDLHHAYHYYLRRSEQLGWDEENYETFFRLGRVCELLSKTDTSFTWHMAFDYYVTAFKMRPHRAEPLIKIAEHYWPDNIPLCYLFARRALDLSWPEQETLFVDREIYEYGVYEVLSKASWYVAEYDIGEYATRKALQACPDLPHLVRNLELYLEKRKSLLPS